MAKKLNSKEKNIKKRIKGATTLEELKTVAELANDNGINTSKPWFKNAYAEKKEAIKAKMDEEAVEAEIIDEEVEVISENNESQEDETEEFNAEIDAQRLADNQERSENRSNKTYRERLRTSKVLDMENGGWKYSNAEKELMAEGFDDDTIEEVCKAVHAGAEFLRKMRSYDSHA